MPNSIEFIQKLLDEDFIQGTFNCPNDCSGWYSKEEACDLCKFVSFYRCEDLIYSLLKEAKGEEFENSVLELAEKLLENESIFSIKFECPECSSVEDDQYYCTTCEDGDNIGSIVQFLVNEIKQKS